MPRFIASRIASRTACGCNFAISQYINDSSSETSRKRYSNEFPSSLSVESIVIFLFLFLENYKYKSKNTYEQLYLLQSYKNLFGKGKFHPLQKKYPKMQKSFLFMAGEASKRMAFTIRLLKHWAISNFMNFRALNLTRRMKKHESP
jgi:hypothetical protein